MNITHLHLLLNHVPLLATVFGIGLLAVALWRRSEALQRAALTFFVVAALTAIPTYLTGEPAEDVVESLPGVTHQGIERHEEFAGWALGGVLALGVVALIALAVFRRHKTAPQWLGALMLVGAVLVTGMIGWTANLGGQIRHTEIRPEPSAAGVPSAASRHHDKD